MQYKLFYCRKIFVGGLSWDTDQGMPYLDLFLCVYFVANVVSTLINEFPKTLYDTLVLLYIVSCFCGLRAFGDLTVANVWRTFKNRLPKCSRKGIIVITSSLLIMKSVGCCHGSIKTGNTVKCFNHG